MRIVQVLHAFNEDRLGGCEVYTARLSRILSETHDVTLLYPAESLDCRCVREERTNVAGLDAIRLRRPAILDPTELYRSAALDDWFDDFLGRERPDIVHVQHLLRLSTGWLEVAAARGVATVLTLHDFWYLCPALHLLRQGWELCPGSRGGLACAPCPRRRHEWSQLEIDAGPLPAEGLRRCRRGLARLLGLGAFLRRQELLSAATARLAISRALRENLVLLDLPHAVVAPSRFIAEEYRRRGVLRDIRHLPHGVPFGKPVEKTACDRLRIAYMGAVASHKGVHFLLEAVRRLPKAALSLAIHGHASGEYREKLERIAEGDARIAFRGPFREDDLPAIHADTDVLVVPSLCHESYALVVQEALALGTPVIVSDRGGMPELVEDGVNGFVVPAGDAEALAGALERLVSSGAEVKRLREGIGRALTSQDNARVMEEIYEEALTAKERDSQRH